MTPEPERPETKSTTATATTTGAQSSPLFDRFAAALAPAPDQLPAVREFAGDLGTRLQNWLSNQGSEGTVPKRARNVLTAVLAEVDAALSAQVNEIIHHSEFQKLEASWRGLEYLVRKSKPDDMTKFKVLDVAKDDLLEDFQAAPQEDLSSLFTKVYEEGYGIYGGQPVGLMVGDYEFSPDTQDVALLTSISRVAAAAHAPFIAAASPELFGWKDFTEIQGKASLSDIFDPNTNPRYAPWKSFRQSESSRYAGLCMPHILLREPYRPNRKRDGVFVFQEEVAGTDHSKFLWGNAAYALATRMTEAFFNHRWCVSIRGPMGGGLVEGLPTFTFPTEQGDIAQTCPTEIALTERREFELSELGFIPLIHCVNTDKAAFFGTSTCQEPKLWNTEEANANSALSARLQYIMATSRFAHYLKVMMRERIGSYMTRDNCQDLLDRWISDYVTKAPDADAKLKAERPLSDARIEVVDDPARPGCYKATAFLRPHFQLEALNISLRLVAELPGTPK
jgi:type VI secretion system protein ImpC